MNLETAVAVMIIAVSTWAPLQQEARAYLVRQEAAPGGGYICYYSDGRIYGPVQQCPPYLY